MILIVVSIVVLVLFILYGFPAILNFTGSLGSKFGKKNSLNSSSAALPTTPRFSQDFEATKSAQIILNGVADGKISVEVFQNERSLGTVVAASDGKFSMDVDLFRGENNFMALAIAENGAKSRESDIYKINYLNSAPKLEITSVRDGDIVKESPFMVVGRTDSNTTVTVNDRLAIVASDGTFSYYLSLVNGDNKIKVTSTDRAGNQTTKEIAVKFNP